MRRNNKDIGRFTQHFHQHLRDFGSYSTVDRLAEDTALPAAQTPSVSALSFPALKDGSTRIRGNLPHTAKKGVPAGRNYARGPMRLQNVATFSRLRCSRSITPISRGAPWRLPMI